MTKAQVAALAAVALSIFTVGCKNQSTTSPNTNSNTTLTQATPDQFANARSLFEKNCKSCHGASGQGGPVKLEDGTRLKVPSLREGHTLRHPDSDFTKQINKGGDGMPAFAEKLKPQEIDELVRFIRHEFQGK